MMVRTHFPIRCTFHRRLESAPRPTLVIDFVRDLAFCHECGAMASIEMVLAALTRQRRTQTHDCLSRVRQAFQSDEAERDRLLDTYRARHAGKA